MRRDRVQTVQMLPAPPLRDLPSTSYSVQYAGRSVHSGPSDADNVKVVIEKGIQQKFVQRPSGVYTDRLALYSNRLVVTTRDGCELLSAPLHYIASIASESLPAPQVESGSSSSASSSSTMKSSPMIAIQIGFPKRDEIRLSTVVLYTRDEKESIALCGALHDLWSASYNDFLTTLDQPLAAISRKRDYSIASNEFGISSSVISSDLNETEENTEECVSNLMRVVAESLPRKKRGIFIQIMKNLSGGKESILLAMLKLIELFGIDKEKVAEFECIVPYDDLDRFYQILRMNNIDPKKAKKKNKERIL